MKVHSAELARLGHFNVREGMAGSAGVTVESVPMRIALTVVGNVNTFRSRCHNYLRPLVGGGLCNAAVVDEGVADAVQVQETVKCSTAFPFRVLLWCREDQEVRVQGEVLLGCGRPKLFERLHRDGGTE